jgi:hypothetical protein
LFELEKKRNARPKIEYRNAIMLLKDSDAWTGVVDGLVIIGDILFEGIIFVAILNSSSGLMTGKKSAKKADRMIARIRDIRPW